MEIENDEVTLRVSLVEIRAITRALGEMTAAKYPNGRTQEAGEKMYQLLSNKFGVVGDND